MGESTLGHRKDSEKTQSDTNEDTRPQKAGEAETTRFGMEDGDNTDVPVKGGPSSNEAPDNPD